MAKHFLKTYIILFCFNVFVESSIEMLGSGFLQVQIRLYVYFVNCILKCL